MGVGVAEDPITARFSLAVLEGRPDRQGTLVQPFGGYLDVYRFRGHGVSREGTVVGVADDPIIGRLVLIFRRRARPGCCALEKDTPRRAGHTATLRLHLISVSATRSGKERGTAVGVAEDPTIGRLA